MRTTGLLVLCILLTASLSAQVYSLQTVAGGALPENIEATSVSLGSGITAVAVDPLGNVYLALEWRHVVLRVNWTGTINRFAGNGYPGHSGDGGSALVATLNRPSGLAVDSAGNVYISEIGNRDVRKVTNGIISTIAGGGSSEAEGIPATQAQLLSPSDVAVDSARNVYIVDESTHRVRRVSAGVINTLVGSGTAGFAGDDGPPLAARLNYPSGVAIHADGSLFIADTGNNRIRKVSGTTITTVAGNGSPVASGDGGPATAAGVASPVSVTVDAAGNIYFTDWNTRAIRKVTAGTISTVAGGGGSFTEGAAAASVGLSNPSCVAMEATGKLLIGDYGAQRVLRVASGVISTVAGGGPAVGDNGPPTSALLAAPAGVAVDDAGAVYIADRDNFRVRKLASGVLTTIAGTSTQGTSGDNGPAVSARLISPVAVAVDTAGNVYVVDDTAQKVRKIAGGIITTFAGTGSQGATGDGGPATSATMNYPAGIATDAAGNVYIADSLNHRVRKVSGGVITTVAGTGVAGFSGDGGQATAAQLSRPVAVAVNAAGDLFIADQENHRIRKVSGGVISTVAGSGANEISGDGGPATAAGTRFPNAVAVASNGDLFFADSVGTGVRRVSGGVITTVAGRSGPVPITDDGGPATQSFISAAGIAIDGAGTIYVAESDYNRLRSLVPAMFSVSAASFTAGAALAPGMIVAGFGEKLSDSIVAAASQPLPTELGGIGVEVTDASGLQWGSPLFLVSPGQINFEVPEGAAMGKATLRVLDMRTFRALAFYTVNIEEVAPGLFAANQNGRNAAAAVAVWVNPSTPPQSWPSQVTFQCGAAPGTCLATPLAMGAQDDKLYLYLYGTGIRGRSGLGAVRATIGGTTATVEYAGAAPGFAGLDQVNVLVPRSLAGRGEVPVVLTVEGKTSNTVTVNFQ